MLTQPDKKPTEKRDGHQASAQASRSADTSAPASFQVAAPSIALAQRRRGDSRDRREVCGQSSHRYRLDVGAMQWDFKDRLQMTQRQAGNADDEEGAQHQGERTYYVYDAAGQRVRKVTERAAGASKTPTRMNERMYLGGLELYREYPSTGSRQAVTLERETLHIMDGKQRIALVETKTIDTQHSTLST